jgi:hypothetical protein
MALEDHQQSYRGLVTGEGTGIRLFQVDGLEDLDVRDGDRDAPRDDGGVPGAHFAAQKTFVLTYRITPGNVVTLEELLSSFYAAYSRRELDQDEWTFKFPGQPERMVRARPIRRTRPRTRAGTVAAAVEVTVAMKATDPRIYSATAQQDVVPILELSEEGFELPVVNLPINMAAAVVADATLINNGTSDAYPILQFEFAAGGSGDVDGLLLTNQTNGATFEMGPDPQSTAYAQVAGQTLMADMDAIVRKVPDVDPIHIGGSSRYTHWQMPREPFHLAPGPNVLTFEVIGDTPSSDVVALVQWRDTDL